MTYSDEWWKGRYGQVRIGCPEDNPSFHSNCGYAINTHPDGYANEEWWGIMRTKDNITCSNPVSCPDIMQPRRYIIALKYYGHRLQALLD